MEALLNYQDDLCSRIFKARNNFKKTPRDRLTKHYFESKLQALEQLWAEFRDGHKLLMTTSDKAKIKATPYITEETYDKTEDEYTRYVCELKDKLAENSQPSQSKTSSENKSIKASVVKLPKISIPNFSGQYHEWTTFRDLFTSMIHNNSSLDSVQKMQYLKSYLTGEAEQLLRNIPVSDTNYERCWSQLEARYNNKKYLSHCILKRLLGQKTATTESAAFLKDLMDTSTDCLSALANLEINVSTWDIMVIHLLTLKLDPESRRQWELNVATNSASDALPTFQQFKEFLTSRYRALEFIEPKSAGRPSPAYGKAFSSSNYNKPNVLHVASAPTLACEYCSGPHKLCFCKPFASEDFVKRHEFVTNNRMCYNCLGSNHSVRFCQKTTSCRICKRKHHSLLHPKEVSTSTASSKTQGQAVEGRGETTLVATENTSIETAPIVSCFTTGIRDEVLLATALVKVQSNVGGYQVIRALLDQGSQASFVTEAVVQALGIKKIPIKGSISGLGGDDTSVVSKYMVQLKVQSLTDPNFNIVLKAYVLSKITTYLPSKRVAVPEWLELKQLALADPTYCSPNKIDVLLGAEVYGQILKEGVLKGPKGTPIAQCTALGWILSGPVSSGSPNKNVTVLHARVSEDDLLKRFWEIEAEPSGQIKRFTAEEQKCEELFAATTVRNEEGRYVVKLPFRDYDPSCKGSSREIAAKRLYTLERKLGKDPGLKARYVDVIREYQQLGHMILVEEPDRKRNEAIYLPHHAVIREDKSTTKVRVVFDASCKNVKGVSLNDLLMTGPTLQPDLRHIIMCWRSYPVCLVADIIKMYRMVRVAEEDTDFQRILWRENPEEDIKDYKLLTVTFGTASAPYLAVKALNQVAYDHKDTYPTAASRVHREFYMDDLMTGCETIEEGLKLYREMKDLLNEGGFVLQKWASNKKELSREINQRERENKEPDDEKDNLEIKTDSIVKILGLTWNRDEDEFQYSVKLPPLSPPATKRKIISDVSRLFDPMGWLAPCVIKAKIFIQRLWISGIGWDEEPPADILQDWLTYREQLAYLVNFRIPRWQHTNLDDAEVELHGFSDASNAAYAAVIYLRVVKASGDINVSLITAKTRVSPVKQISIPRLELCGAVLAAKLLKEVAEVLEIPKPNLRAWTDSTVVLAWLNKHPSNWKTFVANRVSEILTTMDASQWSHVPTKENPADCASRGIRPAELNEYNLWKFGPRLLYSEVITYAKPKNNDTNLEKSTKVHLGVVEEPFWNKYSSLTKLIRVVAYCRRFLKKHESHRNQGHTKHLQRWELDEAMTTCVKICQQASFKPEIAEIKRDGYISSKTSKIRSLTPFLENGILRVGGRLENASEPANVRHPTILPCDSHLSKLIVADAHNRTLHGEQRAMLNYLRSAYWIVRAKDLVKHHIRKCISCIRHKAQIQTQLMGALPQTRVTPARAFIHSGVDYAGPIQLRTSKGRGHHSYKGYICLFICMVTKAIHLEVVSELTSRGFLEAFKRFIARRGRCLKIYSDNGTNFVGAAKELKVLFNAERSSMIPEIVETLASSGTAWHFIPPKSPNFGGLWEAGIKSTKYHIKRVIGDSTLTYEEMSTLLSQIEACLNSRPISVIPSSSDEPNPLTPGHFLIGEPLVTVPETNYESSNVSSLKRWQLTQRMLQQFWRRWSNECLTHYLHRYRWAHQVPEPKVGDVVLVKEDDLPPTKWLFGRITQKHAGSDLLTRVVTIKCKDALIKRPTSKLCILPVTE